MIVACVSTAVGVAAALVIGGYDFPGKETVAACFLSPLMVPPVVIGFGLLMFFATLGVFDGFARLVPDALTCTGSLPARSP